MPLWSEFRGKIQAAMKVTLPVFLILLAGCGGTPPPGTVAPVANNGDRAFYLNKMFKPKVAITMNRIAGFGSEAHPGALQTIWSFIKQAKPTGAKFDSNDWATHRDLRLRIDEKGKPSVLMDAKGQIAWQHKIWKLTPKQLTGLREFLDRAAVSN